VTAAREVYRDTTGRARPVLVWRLAAATRVISTAVLGGGIGPRSWALNAEVAKDYARTDPAVHAGEIAAQVGLPEGSGVAMLTAAAVLDVVSHTDGGVRCDATVGLSIPTWAASADAADPAWAPGTINLLCLLPVPLLDAALVNAVSTATEAKTQALLELGVPGTGTASDAVTVCCPVSGGEPEAFGGPRSPWGARLARAVHGAVAQGTTRYRNGRR
jgi:adenosylcobinamide hydrolase